MVKRIARSQRLSFRKKFSTDRSPFGFPARKCQDAIQAQLCSTGKYSTNSYYLLGGKMSVYVGAFDYSSRPSVSGRMISGARVDGKNNRTSLCIDGLCFSLSCKGFAGTRLC